MHFRSSTALSLLFIVTTTVVAGAQSPTPATASWPAFRGENRDGIYHGSIRVSWEGLTPIWKKPIGGGRSSFAIAGGHAFTIEQRQRNEVVAAYDLMTGRQLWAHTWAERFNSPFMGIMGGGEGPRATPTFADGLVYALGGRGEFRCLDAATGKLVWRTNILQDAGAKNLTWGMAGSPLVLGDSVIVLPGGPAGKSVAAYDRRTGKKLWTALDDKTAYASPMHLTIGGVPQLVVVSASRILGLSLDRRDVLWEFPWKTDHDASAAQPILIGDNRIFYSSGYGTGAVVVELSKAGERFSVREVWRNIRMKNRQSTSVVRDGFIYGLDEGILACLDASTGDLKWKGGRYGHGQILLVGEHLLITTEDGELVLVAASPDRLTEVARVPALDGETWNVPAIADGILLVRNTKQMAAFDLRADEKRVARGDDRLRRVTTGDDGLRREIESEPERRASRSRFGTSAVAFAEAEPERGVGAPASQLVRGAASATKSPREYFVSWGYNGDKFTKSDMHFSQPSLGNSFTLTGVQARDSKAWTDVFNHGLFVPQYNIRIGMFFNDKWGFEVALDHIKWIVRQDQVVRMTGTLNGAPVDADVTLTPAVLKYQLNNGANPIFFNVIRRMRLAGQSGRAGHTTLLAKAGGGFAVPHTENTLFGQNNDDGFQFFRGWDVDAAAAVRIQLFTLFRPFYVEFEEKLLYARYFGVKIDQGKARHTMKANELSFHFGIALGR